MVTHLKLVSSCKRSLSQALIILPLFWTGCFSITTFAEVQTKLAVTMPALTNPGASGGFTVSSESGPASDGEGSVTKTYGGVIEYVLSSGDGRFGAVTGVTRYGLAVDSFQILQSFLTPYHFSLISSNTTCPAAPTGVMNWMLIRLRSPDAARDPMNVNSTSLAIGGTLSYDSTNTPQVQGSGLINLNQNTFSAGSYTLTGYLGASCSSGSMLVRASASTPLDSYGTLIFGNDAAVYISQGGNPIIALALPRTTLSSGTMSALSGQAFTGLYTSYDANTSQTRKNIVLIPDSNGTTFAIESVADLTNPLTRSTVGSFTCTNLNSPALGFCSGTLTIGGVGTKIICEYGVAGTPVLACVAQRQGNITIGVSIVANVLNTSTLAVTLSPTIAEVNSISNTANVTATLTNLSGRKIPTLNEPTNPVLQLETPFSLGAGAFTGSSNSGGACGTSLNAYSTCTVTVGFAPVEVGAFNQLFRVSYDDGTGSVNATAAAGGVAELISLSLSPSTGFIAGSTKQLTVTAHYSDASTQNVTALVTWSVNTPTIGSVDSSGLFTATDLGGSVTITATLGAASTHIDPVVDTPWTGTKLVGISAVDGQASSFATSAQSMARDSLDNLYVTGNTGGDFDGNYLTGTQDIFLTKYNSSGTKVWSKQLGVVGQTTVAAGVAVDTSDNIYATGHTYGNLDGNTLTGSRDMFVTKYNSSGVKQWTQLLGVSSTYTYGYAIDTDASNNVYVAGHTLGGLDGNSLTGFGDFFVTKYNSAGSRQWTKQLGVASKYTYGYGVTVDGGNNVYVAGYTTGGLDGNSLTGTQDFFLTKYNSSGTKQWTRQLGVATKGTYGLAVAADGGNNLYVTGYTTGGLDGNSLTGTQDLFITKYNSSGTKQWTQQLGVATKNTNGNAVTTDSSNNVNVAGLTEGGLDGNSLTGSRDFFVIRYNSAGTKQGTRQLGVASKFTSGMGIANDTSDNVYVAGYSNGAMDGNLQIGGTDSFITKYNTVGVKQWTKTFGVSTKTTQGNSLASDAADNIYLTGLTSGGLDGNTRNGTLDLFVTQYNAVGIKQWTKLVGVSTKSTQARGIATDASNNVYAAGDTTGGVDGNSLTGTTDFIVVKFNSAGTKQWTRQLGASTKTTRGYAVATDASNNVYVTGYTVGDLDGNTLTGVRDFFVTKYNTSGTKQWTKQLGVTSKSANGNGIATDASNNVYVTGDVDGGLDGNSLTGMRDFFLTKYDTAGTKQWTKQLGVSGSSTQTNAISIDSSNNIYVAGFTQGALDGNTLTGTQDIFVTKYNSAGTKIWTKLLGVASKVSYAANVKVDSANNIYVSGYTLGGLDGNTLTGTQDLFVVKYDSSGTKLWSKQLGGANRTLNALAVTTNSENSVFVGGYTNGAFDGATMNGNPDAFITKYNASGTKQ